jgi:serine-type D-Ala-D-Ala endopeptidase (penicillin-binding protein 7)
MMSSRIVALLTAIALQANPAPGAIPSELEAGSVPAQQQSAPITPMKINPTNVGVSVTAKSAIVADIGSGAVLYAKDAKVPRPIASLSKIMTAMVVLDTGLHSDDQLVIYANEVEVGDGSTYLRSGESLPRGLALKAMLSQSVNELANAFADAFPGGRTAFVQAMNDKAHQLGMTSAAFVDPSGLSPHNVASALDIASMLRSASAYPEIRDAGQTATLTFQTVQGRSVKIASTNLLLSSYLNKDPYSIIVGKTGSLPEAGFCLGQVTRGQDGHEVVAVVLGSVDHFSRFQDAKALTGWAFASYKW